MATTLPEKVRNRSLVVGTFIRLPSVPMLQALFAVDECWLDFIVIDAQHQAINDETVAELITLSVAQGVGTMVRIAPNAFWRAELMLDLGADGVIFPVVNSQSDAQEAVSRCRYPTVGVRSVGGLAARAKGTPPPQSDPLCVVQIETTQAVSNASAILQTPGVDALLMGPVDLSRSMGLNFGYGSFTAAREAVNEVASKMEAMATAAGVGVLRHCQSEQEVHEAIETGATCVTISTDVSMLQSAVKQWGNYIREARTRLGTAGV